MKWKKFQINKYYMKIFLAGHKGLVGSAILRKLKKLNLIQN